MCFFTSRYIVTIPAKNVDTATVTITMLLTFPVTAESAYGTGYFDLFLSVGTFYKTVSFNSPHMDLYPAKLITTTPYRIDSFARWGPVGYIEFVPTAINFTNPFLNSYLPSTWIHDLFLT
jgi:hypothetical protein